MKILTSAIAGAGIIALNAITSTSLEATTLSNVTYSGDVSISTLFFAPLTNPVSTSFTVDNFSQRLSDAGDSQLTIPYLGFVTPFVQDYPLLNNLSLNVFVGTGSIFSDLAKTNFLSSFVWDYNKALDILVIDGYDFNNIQGCLNSTCYLTGSGSVQANSVMADISFNLAQTVTPVTGDSSSSVPEPTTLLGILGVGSWLISRRKRFSN